MHKHGHKVVILVSLIFAALVFGYLAYFFAYQFALPSRGNELPQGKPNIILILVDDMPYSMLEFIPKTKSLIGDQGVNFTSAYVSSPLCCPSRSSILSGQYVHNHGVRSNRNGARIFNDQATIATWLQTAGYHTGMFGKYLNGYQFMNGKIPPGWNEWQVLSRSAGYEFYDYSLNENGTRKKYGKSESAYLTTVLKNKIINFIATAPADKPIFAYFATTASHYPATPAPEDIGKFAAQALWRPPNYNEDAVGDKPKWVRDLPKLNAKARRQTDALYRRMAASLQAVDRTVEEVVNALDQTGRLNNTVIIFTSDNGYSLGAHRWIKKECAYEECVHVPMMVRAPGIAPHTEDKFVQNIDLAPSMAEWGGATPTIPVDGASFVQLLRDPSTSWRDTILLENFSQDKTRNFQAVRTKEYSYVEYRNGNKELYDMNTDPYQMQNIVNTTENATIQAELKAKLDMLRATGVGTEKIADTLQNSEEQQDLPDLN